MKHPCTTARKPAEYRPLPLALLTDVQRLLLVLLEIMLLAVCVASLSVLVLRGTGG
jgi:hypothetical protein